MSWNLLGFDPAVDAEVFARELEVLILAPYAEPLGRRPTLHELRLMAASRPLDVRNLDTAATLDWKTEAPTPWPEPMALERLLVHVMGDGRLRVNWLGVIAAVVITAVFLMGSAATALLVGSVGMAAVWILLPRPTAPGAYEAVRKEWIHIWGHNNDDPPSPEIIADSLAGRLLELADEFPGYREHLEAVTRALQHARLDAEELRAAVRVYAAVRAEALIGHAVGDVQERLEHAEAL